MWALLRHLFTPHHTNNHRPKALHPQAILVYILFLLLLQFNLANLRLLVPKILGLATDINVEKLVSLTNQKRAEQGLPPLNFDPQLSQAAAGKAQDMLTKDYWAHNSPDSLTPWVFIRDTGYNYLYAGENLAKNFGNSEGVVNAWMASPSHRANIVRPEYQDVGFAVVNGRLGGEETTLVVQMFARRSSSEIAAKPATIVSSPSPTPVASAKEIVLSEGRATEVTLAAQEKMPVLSSAKNRPLFSLFFLTKNFSLILAASLLFILLLDTVLIWRRRTIRIAGHNFAHFFFLTTVVIALWLTQQGVIR